MNSIWTTLQGKKTYIALVTGALVIIINHFFGPIPNVNLPPDQWLAQLGGLIPLATIRAAIKPSVVLGSGSAGK